MTSPDSTCHLMVVVSQTFSPQQKENILKKLQMSLNKIGKSFEKLDTYINDAQTLDSLSQLSTDTEHKISSHDETFMLDILVNVTIRSFREAILSILRSKATHKYMLLSTLEANSNGDFCLQDSTFSFEDFFLTINDDIKANELTSNLNILLDSNLADLNKSWLHGFEKLGKSFVVELVKPAGEGEETSNSYDMFIGYFKQYLNEIQAEQLMDVSKFTGTLRTNRPSLYIFPAKEGDAAFFTVNGYSMLINGGYDRIRPCFWRFVNMLQQVDSILLTHNDSDSLGGITSFLNKKLTNSAADIKPNVLSVLANLVSSSNELNKTEQDALLDSIQKLKIKLVPLVKTSENMLLTGTNAQHLKTASPQSKYEHINLYSKLGHGSLDLYVLSPFVNSREFKEFVSQQQQHVGKHFSQHKSTINYKNVVKSIPLSHLNSAVVLVVWMPCYSSPASSEHINENQALRLLFTGNAPQNVILNALDKIKDFDLLSHPIYKVKPNVPANSNEASFNSVVSSMKNLNGHTAAKPPSARPPVSQKSIKPQTSASKLSAKPNGKEETKPNNTASKTNGKEEAKPASTTAKSNGKEEAKPKSATTKPATTNTKRVSEVNSASKPAPQVKKSTSRPSTAAHDNNGHSSATSSSTAASTNANRQSITTKASTTKTSNSTTTANKPAPSKAPIATKKPATTTKSEPAKKEEPASRVITKRNSTAPKKASASNTKSTDDKPKEEKHETLIKLEDSGTVIVENPVITNGTSVSEVIANTESNEDALKEVMDNASNLEALVPNGTNNEEVASTAEVLLVDTAVEDAGCIEANESINSNNPTSTDYNNWPNLSPVKRDVTTENGAEADLVDLQDDLTSAVANEIETKPNGFEPPIKTEEEEDLNKTHELPADSMDDELANESNKTSEEGDVKSVIELETNTAPPVSFNVISDDLIDSIKNLNLAQHAEKQIESKFSENGHENGNENGNEFMNGNGHVHDTIGQSDNFNGNETEALANMNDPNNWNLLGLPKPVLPEASNDSAVIDNAFEKPMTLNDQKPVCEAIAKEKMPSSEHTSSKLSQAKNVTNKCVDNINESGMMASTNDAKNWNLLELPRPVHPVVDEGVTVTDTASVKQVTPNEKKPHTETTVKEKTLTSTHSSSKIGQTKNVTGKCVNPVYMEVAYIPAHGNVFYVDSEFFRRVHARYYVLSTAEPNELMLNAIIKGKESWEDHQTPLSILPTYESETLRRWYIQNEEQLNKLKIEVLPAAKSASLTMDDNPELSFELYKLDF